MSSVFHSVRTTAPGVPLVPKPPGPSFQPESSKSGLNQSSAGFSNVYRQVSPRLCEVGTTSWVIRNADRSPLLTAAARSRSTLITARS